MDYEQIMLTYLKGDEERIKHTYGVVERALELGKIYNADLEVLVASAYLHDITKLLTNEEHHNLIKDDELFNSLRPFMYHAYSGYEVAKSLGITNKNILDSIKHHMWGKIEMTLETMILCVSDFCEKNRIHKSAKIVYEKSLTNLLESYLISVEETMSYTISKGFNPNPRQLKVYNYYKEKYGIIKKDI